MDTLNYHIFKVWILNYKNYERLWIISGVFFFSDDSIVNLKKKKPQ